MWPWTASTPGTVYLFHFRRPLGNLANRRAQASHYVGFSDDFERRLSEQLAGRGAKIVRAATLRGIPFDVYHWPACLAVEKLIKRAHNTAIYCPTCAAAAGRAVKPLPVPATQLELPIDLEYIDFPELPLLPIDGYEVLYLKRWRPPPTGRVAISCDCTTRKEYPHDPRDKRKRRSVPQARRR